MKIVILGDIYILKRVKYFLKRFLVELKIVDVIIYMGDF